jgi:hypothetical protein
MGASGIPPGRILGLCDLGDGFKTGYFETVSWGNI